MDGNGFAHVPRDPDLVVHSEFAVHPELAVHPGKPSKDGFVVERFEAVAFGD